MRAVSEDDKQGIHYFTNIDAISDKAWITFSVEHTGYATNTIHQLINSMKEHQTTNGDTQYEFTKIPVVHSL